MKIQNDSLRALLEQGEAHRKPKAGVEGFETLMAQQMGQHQGDVQAGLIKNAEHNTAALAMQIRAAQELGGAASLNEDAGEDFVFDRVNDLLDKWSLYAGAMDRPDVASLKSMYGLLNGMGGELQAIKEAMLGLTGDNSNLAGLVNELEVLATTERIKFDRGDYL